MLYPAEGSTKKGSPLQSPSISTWANVTGPPRAIALPLSAVLPETVLLIIVSSPSRLKIAPPYSAVLPNNVQFLSVTVPS